MSSITVECLESTANEARFKLYTLLKEDSDPKELTSSVFNIFCNSVAFVIRVTWSGRFRINIFTQMNSLNGVTLKCFTKIQRAYKKVDILETDLYTWQLIAEYQDFIYKGVLVYIDLFVCNTIPFKKLYEDEDFTDFELYDEDHVESVHMHRNVLAVSSPVLKSMLLGDWKEAKEGNVQPPGVTKTTLQHFKDYIYLNQLPNEPLDYAKLLTLASYYMLVDLPKLEQRGEEEVSKKFEPENVWEWLEYCVQQKNTKLLLLRLRHLTSDSARISELEIHFGFKNENYEEVLVKDTFNNNFKDLYSDTDFTDFELRVDAEDGISFHKNILAAFSPVLKSLLLGDWKEAKEGYVQPDISKATLQHFKDYLYLKSLPKDSRDCVKLFSIASHYKMPELARDAAIKISQNFKPENAWEWIEYIVENRSKYLLVAILRYSLDEDKLDNLVEYFSKD